MHIEHALVGVVAMALPSLAHPYANYSSPINANTTVAVTINATSLASAGFTSAVNITSVLWSNSTSFAYSNFAPASTVGYYSAQSDDGSDIKAAHVINTSSPDADVCSLSITTVYAPVTTTVSLSGQPTGAFSYALDNGTTSWINGVSPPAGIYTSTVQQVTTVVDNSWPATPEVPATATLTSDIESALAAISSLSSLLVYTVFATTYETTTKTIHRSSSAQSPTVTDIESPATSTLQTSTLGDVESPTTVYGGSPASSSSENSTVTVHATHTHWGTLTRTHSFSNTTSSGSYPTSSDESTVTVQITSTNTRRIIVSTASMGPSPASANSTSWQWVSPATALPIVTNTGAVFPSFSPNGSEGLSYTGVPSAQSSIFSVPLLPTASSKTSSPSSIYVPSSTRDIVAPVFISTSSSSSQYSAYILSSTENLVMPVLTSNSSSSSNNPSSTSVFPLSYGSSFNPLSSSSLVVAPSLNSTSAFTPSSTGNLVSPLFTANYSSVSPSSTYVSPWSYGYQASSTFASSPAAPLSINSTNTSSPSSTSTVVLPALASNSSSSTPSSTYASPTSLGSWSTPTADATNTTCGEVGNYTVNWDDEPIFVPNENDTSIIFPPIFSPYHHMFYANGYAYGPPPAEPFNYTSKPNVAIFEPGLVDHPAQPAAMGALLPGEIGTGSRASDERWWFEAYGADLGCDNNSSGPCQMTITGYRYDATSQKETQAAQQVIEIFACATAKLNARDCPLDHVDFNSDFRGLSGIQFQALVGNVQHIFVMDNLNLGWCDNSCEAGLMRVSTKKRKI